MQQRLGVFGTTVMVETATNNLSIHALFIYPHGQVLYFCETLTPAQWGPIQAMATQFADPNRLENGPQGPVTPRDVAVVVTALEYCKQQPTDVIASAMTLVQAVSEIDLTPRDPLLGVVTGGFAVSGQGESTLSAA